MKTKFSKTIARDEFARQIKLQDAKLQCSLYQYNAIHLLILYNRHKRLFGKLNRPNLILDSPKMQMFHHLINNVFEGD